MKLHRCYNASEDIFPLPGHIKDYYGPFGFPAPADTRRPYITSNFVIGLDGRASFRELEGQNDGPTISRSKEDGWLVDFLRAHHDAQLIGASTLRDEPGPEGRGWDYAIEDEVLRTYRQGTLGLGQQKVLVFTNSGNIDLRLRLFSSPRVEAWVITTRQGQELLRSQLKQLGRDGTINIVSVGEGPRIDLSAVAQWLRQEHGIRTLLCEGGPTLYGEFLKNQLIDEDFRTMSFQILGKSTKAGIHRPTSYGHVSYTPETAPWFRLISLHYALPYHAFFRFRYEGPRPSQD
ncbi:MAG TPA: dihydrofolate reductase family protein [Nitrospiraceae bacterium]|nr:dihydrofolate reductase family protein [Nitrospiraceae bacterium]